MTGPFESLSDPSQDPHGLVAAVLAHNARAAAEKTPTTDCTPLFSPEARPPLRGGTYEKNDALRLLNSHYFVGQTQYETAVYRRNEDGTAMYVAPEQFKLEVQNIFVRGAQKNVAVEKFWKESKDRHQKLIVFKPGGEAEPEEFNLWHGLGVEPRKGWQKQLRLLRHIFEVICRCDKQKFKYLMRWLAWAVQHPEQQAGAVIVLKSRREGTGKSTLGVVMLEIFGQHGKLVDDSDRLLGRFNDWLETTSFVLAEEILWAGDRKTADKLKSRITSDTLQIERKNGAVRQVVNRLHMIMTTNHDHAVGAGTGDRRFVVFDVSEEHACEKAWFEPLYQDVKDGGLGQFLYLLQSLKLGHFHPRQIIKTAEATEQQRMSGDGVSQWAQACIDADAVIGGVGTHDLGGPISAETLREAYNGFCRQNGQRAVGTETFGKACADMFGPRQRLKALQMPSGKGKRRPWGYHVPKSKKWQEKVDARLGIKT